MLTQVGKYQIVEKIGVGGFGTVYKGRDPFIKRSVAIKTCQSEEEEIKKRFFREAEFAGNLHHRNVTTIYDFGVTDDGTPYIVQEFLTGSDLDKAIKKKEPLTLQRKLQILIDVCDGLGYAHGAGIIHRDIKPSNIRILEDGTVKIMDFGIAKSMVSQSTLTQTGITLGTASYLAPEQIRGEDLDPRTDIFSLGVLAYEMLTGQKPFTGDHISTVLYKIMNEPPAPPSSLDPALPHGLDAMVLKALEKDRAKRFSSCGEMRADCIALLQSVPQGPAFQMPEGDTEKTIATPTSGIPNTASVSRRTPTGGRPPRVLDTPLAPATPSPTSGGIGDVRLHTDTGASHPVPVREEGGGSALALKVLLAAVVLLAVAGSVWYIAQQRHAVVPVAPTPVPVPTAAPAPTALPEPTPTSVPVPTVAVKEVPTDRCGHVQIEHLRRALDKRKTPAGQPPGRDARHAEAGTVRRRLRRSGFHEGPGGIRDPRRESDSPDDHREVPSSRDPVPHGPSRRRRDPHRWRPHRLFFRSPDPEDAASGSSRDLREPRGLQDGSAIGGSQGI